MKHARKTALAASAFTCAALFSFGWSEQGGISLSIESAQARVGRPLTPVSVAGVARRQNRRAAYSAGWQDSQPYWGARSYVGGPAVAGAAAVGTAAAIGTAGAVAATSPWGWGGSPYQTGAGYYAGGPSGGPGWGAVSSSDRALYIKNLHDAGYDPKNNFNSNGTIKTQ
jgi:hypothetical protein